MIIENIPPKFQSDLTNTVGEDTFYWKTLTTAQRTHTHIQKAMAIALGDYRHLS